MITDQQIMALEVEAVEAGDDVQVCICRIARDEPVGGYMAALSPRQCDRLIAMDRDSARAECERVIAHARAQEDADMDLAVSETRAHRARTRP